MSSEHLLALALVLCDTGQALLEELETRPL